MDEDEALGYLADMEGLLNEGTVSERRVILKSFVKEILKGDAEATVFYTLPMPPERVSVASASALTLGSFGGAEGARTPDPLLAKQVLSQLSYSPTVSRRFDRIHSELYRHLPRPPCPLPSPGSKIRTSGPKSR